MRISSLRPTDLRVGALTIHFAGGRPLAWQRIGEASVVRDGPWTKIEQAVIDQLENTQGALPVNEFQRALRVELELELEEIKNA
jgi:hypothetical protein